MKLDEVLELAHPITGSVAWTVPGRRRRPGGTRETRAGAKPDGRSGAASDCAFCPRGYALTTPEKARLVRREAGFERLEGLEPERVFADDAPAAFRRFANLYPIVGLDYWRRRHGIGPSSRQLEARDRYLAAPVGRRHVLELIRAKYEAQGRASAGRVDLSDAAVLEAATELFAGSHDLIVPREHFVPGADDGRRLCSSGELSCADHQAYFSFTVWTLDDIAASNPAVRYVCVFQNWLTPAGASFDHLHKQVVGIDRWGEPLRLALAAVARDRRVYSRRLLAPAIARGWMVAENDHAIAFTEPGHRFPTVAVYSKSAKARPGEHSGEELRAMSDLTHACHAALGAEQPCNEEWFYAPFDAAEDLPWHILIQWRLYNLAGFEAGLGIHIDPVGPGGLRERLVARLYDLRVEERIAVPWIGDECPASSDCLDRAASR